MFVDLMMEIYSTCILNLHPLLLQKDVRSDPKVVQDVSTATDNLLESLGSLAVEVSGPSKYLTATFRAHREQGDR